MPMSIRAPHLRWRHYSDAGSSIAYWICPTHLIKKGYQIKSQRLWKGPIGTKPTDDEMIEIMRHCYRLTAEVNDWCRNPNHHKSPRYRQNGVVYFIQLGDKVKIGFTANVNKRISQLRMSNPEKLELIGTIPGNRYIEEFIHWMFREVRESGEWFRLTDDLAAFIFKNATKTMVANAWPKNGERGSKFQNGSKRLTKMLG